MPPTAAAPPETTPTPAVPPTPSARSGRPAWQRHGLFKLFSSVKLAVVLLAVIVVASIAGTLYETSFDAKVARAYVYNAWWFDVWLTVLCVNLACAAFSRMPWKRHHTGFLITHLGIIILLIGAMIGRGWGIEGTMTIFKNQPPNNQLVVDQRVLRVEEGSSVAQYPVNIIGRHPAPGSPWQLGRTPAGWDVALVDYAPLIDAAFEPQAVPPNAGGQPAVRIKLVSKRLKQTMDNWLMAGDADHGTLDLGLASVQVRHGVAPTAAGGNTAVAAGGDKPGHLAPTVAPTPAAEPVDESVIAFALKPDDQVSQPAQGNTPSGAKVRLVKDVSGKEVVFIDWRGASWNFDPTVDNGKDQDLSGSGLNVTILNYWPDFLLGANGQPSSASDQPNNPAVLVRVHGRLPAANADDQPPASLTAGATLPGGNGNPGADNQAIVYCDDAGGLTFTLKSGASPDLVRGPLTPGQAINTGWADWQLTADTVLPSAVGQTTFHPVKDVAPVTNDQSATSGDPGVVGGGMGGSGGGGPSMASGNHAEGVRVRMSKGGESHEEWAAAGWQVTLPTTPAATRLAYDFQVEPLPIGLQLQDFKVEFNEGTTDPSSFRSFVQVTDVDGTQANGSCSMNHPFNYPGHWWNTFSGLTFKMSQASWNPENLNQSSVQILRDPGWMFKWIGSLLICGGIFALFYLRPPKISGTAR